MLHFCRSGSEIYDIQPTDGLLDDMTELLTATIPEDRLTSSSDESYIYSDLELNGDDHSEPLVKPSEKLHHGKSHLYADLIYSNLIELKEKCSCVGTFPI